jgi:type IV secretory pathway TrbD component
VAGWWPHNERAFPVLVRSMENHEHVTPTYKLPPHTHPSAQTLAIGARPAGPSCRQRACSCVLHARFCVLLRAAACCCVLLRATACCVLPRAACYCVLVRAAVRRSSNRNTIIIHTSRTLQCLKGLPAQVTLSIDVPAWISSSVHLICSILSIDAARRVRAGCGVRPSNGRHRTLLSRR